MAPDKLAYKEELRHILTSRTRHVCCDPALTCAAVLIPLLLKEGTWHVLVTQRTNVVEHHKGQISFPGGACEVTDIDAQTTALREAYEEIGVAPQDVEVLGVLDDLPTVSSFVVTPVVGVIPHPYPYRLSLQEVEAVMEVPLSFLRNPANLRVEQRNFGSELVDVLFWDYGAHTIWGATARILKSLLDLLWLSEPSPGGQRQPSASKD
jgi:8-oxo-dGTP pyrophosphatase MutT (NUDIX family)